jgi:hypothetical protein
MDYLPKDADKLTDKELAEQLFPKEALDKIKAELDKEPTPKKKP